MKIGIITFWESKDNYGQILQCFALQKFLRERAYNAFVIRYKKPNIELPNKRKRIIINRLKKCLRIYTLFVFVFNKIYEKILYKDINRPINEELTHKLRDFETFKLENINYSESVFDNVEQLRNFSPECDCLITGSDQVWHYSFLCVEGAPYFLDFGNEKVRRISYAPSFGEKYVPRGKWQLLYYRLTRFNAISVREQYGKETCKHLGIESDIVLDPTMLLSKDVYDKIINGTTPERFVYLYILNITSPMDIAWNKIDNFLKRHNMKAIVTNGSGGFPAKEWFTNVDYQYSTIPQWISNIKNSCFFLTTSFHGVVFAILMHANFVFIPIRVKEANFRAENLLQSLNLSDRVWNYRKDLDKIFENNIDWEKVDAKLSVMREKSISWLLNNIKCDLAET